MFGKKLQENCTYANESTFEIEERNRLTDYLVQ